MTASCALCTLIGMDEMSLTAAGVIDTFLVLLIGVGPKLALVPFVEVTASLRSGSQAACAAQDAHDARARWRCC